MDAILLALPEAMAGVNAIVQLIGKLQAEKREPTQAERDAVEAIRQQANATAAALLPKA